MTYLHFKSKTDFLHPYKFHLSTPYLKQRPRKIGCRPKTVTQVTSIDRKSPMFSVDKGEDSKNLRMNIHDE